MAKIKRDYIEAVVTKSEVTVCILDVGERGFIESKPLKRCTFYGLPMSQREANRIACSMMGWKQLPRSSLVEVKNGEARTISVPIKPFYEEQGFITTNFDPIEKN